MSEQKNWKAKWNKAAQSIARVLGIAVAGTLALEVADVWAPAGDLVLPLLGCELLVQAYLLWNQHRKGAVVSLAAGALVLIGSLIYLFVK